MTYRTDAKENKAMGAGWKAAHAVNTTSLAQRGDHSIRQAMVCCLRSTLSNQRDENFCTAQGSETDMAKSA